MQSRAGRGRLPPTELNALVLNCTLKKSPEPSNTQGLIEIITGHFDELGVKHETLRPVDFKIPFGVVSDMGEGDEWLQILARILKQHPIPPEGNTVPGWQPDDCGGHDDRMPAGHVG